MGTCSVVKRLPLDCIDPSLALGFYCRNRGMYLSLPSDYSTQLVLFDFFLILKTVSNEMKLTKSTISVYLDRGI